MLRIWKKHKLQPHRVESFKFSSDPDFAPKLGDVVGLYMNPPDKAIVLSVDEKSQIQALDRTQPIFRCGRVCWSGKRTITSAMERPRSSPRSTFWRERSSASASRGIDIRKFLRFLDRIDQSDGMKVSQQ